jgi:hypothetical protein
MKEQDWYMTPMERLMLADWLDQFNGHAILNVDVLPSLEPFGLKWWGRRLSYMSESVEIQVHQSAYFQEELKKAGGRGSLTTGNWLGVWALDVASAVLSLALAGPDPTTGLHARSTRYRMIVTMLRPETPVTEVSGLLGEIRG